jgi:hypothetical protein
MKKRLTILSVFVLLILVIIIEIYWLGYFTKNKKSVNINLVSNPKEGVVSTYYDESLHSKNNFMIGYVNEIIVSQNYIYISGAESRDILKISVDENTKFQSIASREMDSPDPSIYYKEIALIDINKEDKIILSGLSKIGNQEYSTNIVTKITR